MAENPKRRKIVLKPSPPDRPFSSHALAEKHSIIFIDSARKLESLIQALELESEIGVDLEADSLHHYKDRVCLIQISTRQNDWIVDPLQGDFLQPLWRIFESPNRVKIFHDADFDLRSLNRDYGLELKNIFDTKISLELLGHTNVGLAAVLDEYFQAESKKRFQKYQWSKRPLSHEAVVYAAGDTHYLIQLKKILIDKLIITDRLTWAEQEFKYLETIRWQPSKKEALSYWRLFDKKNKSPQYRECLRLVWTFREKIAQEQDKPVFKIFHDDVFSELSWLFTNPSVKNQKTYLKRIVPSAFRDAVADCIYQAQKTPDDKCPEYPSSLFEPAPPYDKELFKKLGKRREWSASQKNIDPGIIVGNSTLKKMARLAEDDLKNYQIVKQHTGLRPWQWSLLTADANSTEIPSNPYGDQ
ncbi:MAG: ribonuclease D [bacterium]